MDKPILVLGGSGFIGRHLLAHLEPIGCPVRIISRTYDQSRELLVLPHVRVLLGQAHDIDVLRPAMAGVHTVVNLIGILHEHRRGAFDEIHVELPRRLVRLAAENNCRRLIHISATGAAQDTPSAYLRSKAAGEQVYETALEQDPSADLEVHLVRPSVVVGPDDHLIQRFLTMARLNPVMLPLPAAQAQLAPVYVNDLVMALVQLITNPHHHAGLSRWCFCGPQTMTLQEMVATLLRLCNIKRRVVPMPDGLARLAAAILERLPGTLLSRDNLDALTVPSLCATNDLPRCGVPEPLAFEAVVRRHFAGHHGQRRYDGLRSMAN